MKTKPERRPAQPTDVVIVGAARTPQGRILGALANLSATDLGGAAISGALSRAGIPADAVDAVIMGQVLQSGTGQNPARQSAVAAGIPLSAHAITLNKVCLSGLAAIIEASRMLRLSDASLVVAGGQESMSQAPRLVKGTREGNVYGTMSLIDAAAHDGLTDAFDHQSMGLSTDRANDRCGITREIQDTFAAASHLKAASAQTSGVWDQETVTVHAPTRKGTVEVSQDQSIRPETSPEKLARLRPAFSPEGSITAGNASPLSDGAAAVVLTTRRTAQEQGWTVLCTLRSYGQVAGPDTTLLDKPALAIKTALEKEGWSAQELDLVEINEAFASVASYSGEMLDIPYERINIHGGAIALGHPIGASGARLVVTAAHALIRQGHGRAAVSLCGGGGQGDALLMER
ncbi:acetyl-CoA C-acetyltransferase [Paenarthrobacter sp. NPDC089675]|uniref:acetyl-CoA C-acetyltransferase n=1 Tax=Paenarthrobacter TaxID=1742992 RepID=UPI003810E117